MATVDRCCKELIATAKLINQRLAKGSTEASEGVAAAMVAKCVTKIRELKGIDSDGFLKLDRTLTDMGLRADLGAPIQNAVDERMVSGSIQLASALSTGGAPPLSPVASSSSGGHKGQLLRVPLGVFTQKDIDTFRDPKRHIDEKIERATWRCQTKLGIY